jgi:hypothetical protein
MRVKCSKVLLGFLAAGSTQTFVILDGPTLCASQFLLPGFVLWHGVEHLGLVSSLGLNATALAALFFLERSAAGIHQDIVVVYALIKATRVRRLHPPIQHNAEIITRERMADDINSWRIEAP